MNVFEDNLRYIITPSVTSISESVVDEIRRLLISLDSNKTIVLNLEGVETCVNKFFIMLNSLNFEITLVNPESTLLAFMCMSGFDKCVRIFGEMVSLNDNKHEIVNRRFSVV